MNIPFEIVVGTYEEFLLGYKPSEDGKNALSQSFATHEHSASIRCISVNGNFLATGAADDRIIVYDMKTRKEHCMLTHHNGTVNCLEFTNGHTHLISGSADGVLAITRVGNWQLEKLWEKPHKGSAILSIAVHSSGKLALTLGSDYTLRTWNLVKGRQAYAINLTTKSADAKSLEKIIWSTNGQWFSLIGGFHTEIWTIETGGLINFVKHQSRVTTSCWIGDETVVSGLEDGQLCMFNVNTKEETLFSAHSKRVKCLKCFEKWLISADSGGEIIVWTKSKFKLLAKCNTGCRITCLDIVALPKIKKEEEDVEVSSDVVAHQSSSSEVIEVTELKQSKNKRKKSMQRLIVEIHEDDAILSSENKETPSKKLKTKKKKLNTEKAENGPDESNSKSTNQCSDLQSKHKIKKKKKTIKK